MSRYRRTKAYSTPNTFQEFYGTALGTLIDTLSILGTAPRASKSLTRFGSTPWVNSPAYRCIIAPPWRYWLVFISDIIIDGGILLSAALQGWIISWWLARNIWQATRRLLQPMPRKYACYLRLSFMLSSSETRKNSGNFLGTVLSSWRLLIIVRVVSELDLDLSR